MFRKLGILILVNTFSAVVNGEPKCPVKDTCTHPKVVDNLDPKWVRDAGPPDGWHMEWGSKVARLHVAELIKGKDLTYDDDYSKMCARFKLVHGDEATEGLDGKYYGFDSEQVDFQCHHSEKEIGVFVCDYSHTGLTKYTEEKVSTYVTYSDNKNVLVFVKCFPNGESGWFTISKSTSLSQEEKNLVLNHIKALGFDNTDIIQLYNEKICPLS